MSEENIGGIGGSGAPDNATRRDRVPYLDTLFYEATHQLGEGAVEPQPGEARTVNISSGGMLLMMEEAPALMQVLKIFVPIPAVPSGIPTLAEVRWIQPLVFSDTRKAPAYYVGVKFLF